MKFLPLISVFAVPFLTALAEPTADPWDGHDRGLSRLVGRSWDDDPLPHAQALQRRGLGFSSRKSRKEDELAAMNAKDMMKMKGG